MNNPNNFRNKMIEIEQATGPNHDELYSIWSEKRGRDFMDYEPQYSMVIALDEPRFNADNIANEILQFLSVSDASFAYNWSKDWGQARIALRPSDSTPCILFVDTSTDESKKFLPIMTSIRRIPSSIMKVDDHESDSKIKLVINDDEPVSMEGAVLQIERMVDEAIWTKCFQIESSNKGISGAEAYRQATQYVSDRGVYVTYTTAEFILNLKRQMPNTSVRLYGDIHEQSTIPPVIGAVVYENIPGFTFQNAYGKEYNTYDGLNQCPISHNELFNGKRSKTGAVALFSITAGKRPHLGHMMLATKAYSILRNYQTKNICIEVNDTGPKIDSLVESASMCTGLSTSVIADGISEGTYGLEAIEQWYTRRNKEPNNMYYVPRDTPLVHMDSQAISMKEMFRSYLATLNISTQLSSRLDTSHILSHSEVKWQGSGFELIEGKVLRKRAGATAFLSRLSFIDHCNKVSSEDEMIYVDSDTEISASARIYSHITGRPILSMKGAAVGFDFNIHSGSLAKDELSLKNIVSWYRQNADNDGEEFKDDLEYLMLRIPVSCPQGDDSTFYNFSDVSSFKDTLLQMRRERLCLINKLLQDVPFNISPLNDNVTFRPGLDKAQQGTIRRILRLTLGRARNNAFDTGKIQDINMAITPHDKSQSAFMDTLARGAFSVEYDRESLNIVNKNDGIVLDKDLTESLVLQGYKTAESLNSAAIKIKQKGIVLMYNLTPYQLAVKNTRSVYEGTVGIGESYLIAINALRQRVLSGG